MYMLMASLGLRIVYLCTNNAPQGMKSLKMKLLSKKSFLLAFRKNLKLRKHISHTTRMLEQTF